MTLSRGHAWMIALVATLTMTVSYIDRQTLSVLGLAVSDDLHIDPTEWGLLQSAFAFAYLIATPLGGWWISRIGPRRGLVISVLVWSAVAALHAAAASFAMLFMLRIALGLAEGPSYPGSAQTIQSVLPPEDRSRGFGVLFSGSSIGGMIVPPLAAAVFAWKGWQEAFLITSAVGLLWIPLWVGVTSHRAVKERIDASIATIEKPSLWQVLRRPAIQRGLISVLAAAPPIGFMLGWGAKYLGATFDTKQEEVGRYLWLPPLLFDLGAILFGDLAARIRRPPGESPRMLYTIAMVLTMALIAVPFAGDPWTAVAIVGVSVLGAGGLYTLNVADAYARVEPQAVSVAGGLIACGQSIAFIVLNPLIGAVVKEYGHYDGVAIGIGLWTIVPCAIWLAWKPRPA